MSYLQAILMAVLQGVTELFPVSSLGHAVIVPAALTWPIDPRGPGFLPFLVILHLGTATALLIYFWQDWIHLLLALVGAGDRAARPAYLKLLKLLVIGTIPAALAGYFFNHALRENFGAPGLAAMFLIVNGAMLFIGDRRHRLRAQRDGGERGKPIADLTVTDAAIIGVVQCAALLPGISRSGATIVAGLARRLSSDAAAHFSFLLAAPIIGGAGLLEVPKLVHAVHDGRLKPEFLTMSIVSGVVAGVAAYLSVAFLTRYFRATEIKMMRPFAIYCALAGAAALAWFILRPNGA
ncbi:MAG TPA: undecaprenyl-diphosphate phosphatase [Alphaproteobacteria bacterium]|nr:undecaprenyl-diphosphate phosphatase [Alphaproteobacteria bacterium]